MKYTASVKDIETGQRSLITREYPSKAAFERDIKANGFRALRIETEEVYSWVMENTDCSPVDFRRANMVLAAGKKLTRNTYSEFSNPRRNA